MFVFLVFLSLLLCWINFHNHLNTTTEYESFKELKLMRKIENDAQNTKISKQICAIKLNVN